MFTSPGVYKIEIEDGVIVRATLVTPTLAVVVDKSNRDDRLELKIGGTTRWYYLSDEPTMVEIGNRDLDAIDIYDIEIGKYINIYIMDSEISYVGIGNIYIPTYKVTYSVVGENGTLTSDTTSGSSVVESTTVKFTATPAEGYQIKEWKVNGVVKEVEGNVLSLPITSITDVTVEFQVIPKEKHLFSYSVVNSNGGVLECSVESGSEVEKGSVVTLTAVADEGYQIKEWKVNNEVTEVEGNELTLTINEKVTVTVEFIQIP